MTWKKTTLEKFAGLYNIQTSDIEQEAKALSIYEFMTGKDPAKQSYSELGKWAQKNAWLEEYPKNIKRWVWCKGLYRIELNPAKYSGDDFTTINAYLQTRDMGNLAEIMAKMCRPLKWLGGKTDWSERVSLFQKHMTAWQAYGTAVFFYRLWTVLSHDGLNYSPSEIRRMKKGQSPKRLLRQPANGLI